MNNRGIVISACLPIVLGIGQCVLAEDTIKRETSRILDEITATVERAVSEVVDEAAEKARGVVRENTGIDLKKRGYDLRGDHKPLPRGASVETRRELEILQAEHDREIHKLQEELDRKLAKARGEFEREAAKEKKVEKVHEKREKLQRKVDAAYAKFDDKVSAENRRFDEKRTKIVEREVGKAGKDRSAQRREPHVPGDRDEKRERNSGNENTSTADRGDADAASDSQQTKKRWWEVWK